MAVLRLTPFKPTRRFWSVGWVRFEGRICGVSIAARKRALAVDWLEWLRRGER